FYPQPIFDTYEVKYFPSLGILFLQLQDAIPKWRYLHHMVHLTGLPAHNHSEHHEIRLNLYYVVPRVLDRSLLSLIHMLVLCLHIDFLLFSIYARRVLMNFFHQSRFELFFARPTNPAWSFTPPTLRRDALSRERQRK